MSATAVETASAASQAHITPMPRAGGAHPVLAFFACAAILLPAHPSLQSIFLSHGIPSPLVSALFAAPLLYAAAVWPLLTRPKLSLLLLFLAYICWIFGRALFSPAFGQPNFFAALRGVLVLTPLSLLCAVVAARNPKCAARVIFVFGLIAITHFSILVFFGRTFSETAGFRSLSADPEKQNYQSTSFYFGVAGVAMACTALRYRGLIATVGMMGTALTVTLMGAVGARAALVALVAGAAAIVAQSSIGRLARIVIVTVPTLTLVVFFAWLSGIIDFEALRNQLVIIDRFLVLTEGDDSSQRVRLFASALSMWLDSPASFLFGGGLGAFPAYIGETTGGWYPHNFVLESLAEGGLIAGLLLIAIGVRLITELAKLKSNTADFEKVYLGALAVYAVVAYQFMGGLQTLWIPTFFVALFIFSNSQSRA